jgi:hypothetical protein
MVCANDDEPLMRDVMQIIGVFCVLMGIAILRGV